MAHLGNAFECDICQALRKPESTGWYIGMPGDVSLVVARWDDRMALYSSMKHLCGIECAQKWVGQQLSAVQP
jgi:hypothetical protein